MENENASARVERPDIPSTDQLKRELSRLRQKSRFYRMLRSTIASLVVIAAIAVIISTMLMPVLRVTGTSMTPTLRNDEVILCSKLPDIKRGDIIAFYYNNKVLLKRVIGLPGDVIDMDANGIVSRNGDPLDEPYVSETAVGECDIEMPCQVPENRLFVMGDHRAVSIDSRSTSVGCIAEENVIGRVFAVVSPLKSLRLI